MSQIPLPILFSRAPSRSMIMGEPNRAASDLLSSWQRWSGHTAILTGPQRSGRSSLAAQFAGASGGIVIDDADQASETELFHSWNGAQADGLPLLLVADAPPPIWKVSLPDLRTRLATAVHAAILPPDEPMAAALIAAGLDRAGAAFAPDVPGYLAIRLPRCYLAIEQAVDILNATSLSTSRKISVALARSELEQSGLLE